MPLTGPLVAEAIIAAAPELKGSGWYQIATAVGVGVATWAVVPSNLTLQGATSGASGSGTVAGKLQVSPSPLPVSSAALSQGLLGVSVPAMTRAVGVGVANAFNASAMYQGVSTGVGAGTDVSKVTAANASTLVASLLTAMNGQGLHGIHVPRLASALGTGVAALLLTTTGLGIVTGPAGPTPSVGTSMSRVV